MNFAIQLKQFDVKQISFLDSKKNMLMDGYFTKINYLSKYFTMNGLFFYIPIKIKYMLKERSSVKFDPYLPENHLSIQKFSAIENEILDFYIMNKQTELKKQLLFAKQLFNGVLKLNIDNSIQEINDEQFVVKISGVWEANKEIGITYKLFKAEQVFNF